MLGRCAPRSAAAAMALRGYSTRASAVARSFACEPYLIRDGLWKFAGGPSNRNGMSISGSTWYDSLYSSAKVINTLGITSERRYDHCAMGSL
jgi:hypothetical protein